MGQNNRSQGTTVFVGNISYDTSEDELREVFTQVGNVVSFRLLYDQTTGRAKGYGFCEYEDKETAMSARRNLNGTIVNGRPLRVDQTDSDKPPATNTPANPTAPAANANGLVTPTLPPPAPVTTSDTLAAVNATALANAPPLATASPQPPQPPAPPPAHPSLPPALASPNPSMALMSLPDIHQTMVYLKRAIVHHPNEMRDLLSANPRLAHAILQGQIMLGMIPPPLIPPPNAPPANLPANLPTNLPANLPTNLPTNLPNNLPVNPPARPPNTPANSQPIALANASAIASAIAPPSTPPASANGARVPVALPALPPLPALPALPTLPTLPTLPANGSAPLPAAMQQGLRGAPNALAPPANVANAPAVPSVPGNLSAGVPPLPSRPLAVGTPVDGIYDEQTAILSRVINLTPEEIDELQPDHRQYVLQIKELIRLQNSQGAPPPPQNLLPANGPRPPIPPPQQQQPQQPYR